MTIKASELELLAGQFAVIIPGVSFIGSFRDCSEPKIEIAEISKRVGGRLHAKKIPGSVSFENWTVSGALLRGNQEMYDKIVSLSNVLDQRAITESDLIYEEIHIIQLSRAAQPLIRYRLKNCWFKSYTESKFDADAEEIRLGTAEISVETWSRADNVGAIPELGL